MPKLWWLGRVPTLGTRSAGMGSAAELWRVPETRAGSAHIKIKQVLVFGRGLAAEGSSRSPVCGHVLQGRALPAPGRWGNHQSGMHLSAKLYRLAVNVFCNAVLRPGPAEQPMLVQGAKASGLLRSFWQRRTWQANATSRRVWKGRWRSDDDFGVNMPCKGTSPSCFSCLCVEGFYCKFASAPF